MSGDFAPFGYRTITEHRNFVQDGVPIWHRQVIGDPHLNYYEGSATISNLKLYVPRHG